MSNNEVQVISLGDFDLENVADVALLEDDEYELLCRQVKVKMAKESGLPYLNFMFTCPTEPDSDAIFHIANVPHKERSDEANKLMKRDLKTLTQAFGLPFDAKSDEFVGERVWAYVGREEYDGRTRNVIKSFIIRK